MTSDFAAGVSPAHTACAHEWKRSPRIFGLITCTRCGAKLPPHAPEIGAIAAKYAPQLVRHTGGDTALAQRLLERIFGIEGWLHPQEEWELHEAARTVEPRKGAATVVEIGSYKGRSTVALALGVEARGTGRVFAVDPHRPEDGHWEEFLDNLNQADVVSLVEPMRMLSLEARPQFRDSSVHVLFVDGSHSYKAVSSDITAWTPALADGAKVAFNDPFLPGVRRALRELVLTRRSPYRQPRLIVNTLFLDYTPSAPWTAADRIVRMRVRSGLALGEAMKAIDRQPMLRRLRLRRVMQHLVHWLTK